MQKGGGVDSTDAAESGSGDEGQVVVESGKTGGRQTRDVAAGTRGAVRDCFKAPRSITCLRELWGGYRAQSTMGRI